MVDLITENLDLWSSAYIAKKTAGRGSSTRSYAYGIQKLRELILELAVRGKLVPPDPTDEPASILLEKIEQEKELLVKEGKIKNKEQLAKIAQNEKLFVAPYQWEFCRLGTLFNSLLSGGTPSKSNPRYWNGSIPWASVKDLGESKYIETTQDFITEDGLAAGSKLADTGDILICTRMGLGKIAICKNPIAINQDLKAVKLTSYFNIDYFLITFSTLNIIGTGTTVSGIRQDKLLNIVIPIPPLAEQYRIVSKVEELMTLCDHLEEQQNKNTEAHKILVETLLHSLTSTKDTQEFQESWNRIAEHFDTLFTTEQSIDTLKQTILQLAVMGKLVPQDPNDEPATVLLKKIAQEKEKLIKEGSIRKQPKFSNITDDEELFDLPKGWVWARLGNLGLGNTGKTPETKHAEFYNGNIQFIGPGQITPNGKLLQSDKTLTELGSEYSTVSQSGDILMVCIGGSIGKSVIVYSKVAYNQQINALTPIYVNNELLNYFMQTDTFQMALLENSTGSATPIINRGKWEELVLPLPPLDEQHRIVAKVDELIVLCDALKQRIEEARTTQIHLADAIVEQAVK